jgi:hypothetical protein
MPPAPPQQSLGMNGGAPPPMQGQAQAGQMPPAPPQQPMSEASQLAQMYGKQNAMPPAPQAPPAPQMDPMQRQAMANSLRRPM